MIRHTLLLFYRNIKRFKSTFFINLVGLSTGLACALLIYLWVDDELSMDKFHANDDRLFQVLTNHHRANGIETMEGTPIPLAQALAEEVPEVKYASSVYNKNVQLSLWHNNDKIKAMGQFAAKDYFKMFSYPLLHGDSSKVLNDKNSIVISEKLARQMFNSAEGAIGKVLKWEIVYLGGELTVSGVFKDVPSSASYTFDFILSYDLFKDPSISNDITSWTNYNPSCYVLLEEGVNIELFKTKIEGFLKEKAPESDVTLLLQPYSDKYLYGQYENGNPIDGRIEYVRLFSIIAILILAVACINFMNLSTAKASQRIKEIGIKKAIGAGRGRLIVQYLGESLLLTFLSLLVAILLIDLLLPQFNTLTGKNLALHFNTSYVLIFGVITLLTGLISGSYPALYLSSFNPALVLKGMLNTTIAELWARKGLVIFQFSLSIILIVSVIVVYKQISFIQTKQLGYNKDNTLMFLAEGKAFENVETFHEELRKVPGVVSTSGMRSGMFNNGNWTSGISWEGKAPDEVIKFSVFTVDYGLIETLGITLAEGRSFAKEFNDNELKLIFNKAGIDAMGLKNPIGSKINMWGNPCEIIGVVENFHFKSLHEPISPSVLRVIPKEAMGIVVKIEQGKEAETIKNLQGFYHAYNPGYVLDYIFMNDEYQELYVAEQRVGTLSKYFAALAILISCLGLFGLSAFTAERRTKEIGIRKVMGASAFEIVHLLSVAFMKMIFISIAIALPISYFVTKTWLEGFAYRIDLAWWYFVIAAVIALLITWVTVASQAIKAAGVNPAKCLRGE